MLFQEEEGTTITYKIGINCSLRLGHMSTRPVQASPTGNKSFGVHTTLSWKQSRRKLIQLTCFGARLVLVRMHSHTMMSVFARTPTIHNRGQLHRLIEKMQARPV